MTAYEAIMGQQRWLYSPQRALQAVSNMMPVRIFSILFPLWEVEIIGLQRRSREYEMIEKFLERGIAEGELCSIADLSAFFGLRKRQIQKGISFLRAIGHVQGDDGDLTLTKQGWRSLKDGVVYRELETRRKLYFEAFQSRPLLKAHYGLRILSEAEALTSPERNYKRLSSLNPWRTGALSALVKRSNRDDWNLPGEIHEVKEEAVRRAFLPMYIVQVNELANSKPTSPRYVVLNRLRDLHDPFFEEIVNTVEAIQDVFLGETEAGVGKLMENRLEDYGLESPEFHLTELAPDAWRAILPSTIFSSNSTSLSVSDIGQFELVRGYCLQIWCDDPAIRREAALDKAVAAIAHWQQPPTLQAVERLLETITAQLQTAPLDIEQLLAHALEREAASVVAKLEEFEKD